MLAALARVRQPEYTGENRCLPCTVVNLAIALLLAAVAGVFLSPMVGAGVLGISVVLIVLRGYLVPGTPELTRRYLPQSVLAWFGKTAPEPEGAVAFGDGDHATNAMEAALATGVVQECEDVDDLCLTDDFAAAWWERIDDLRESEADRITALADALDLPTDDGLTINEIAGAWWLRGAKTNEPYGQWPSEAALIADAAAVATLASHTPETWEAMDPDTLGTAVAGLRSFLERCPACDGDVILGEETIQSCCHERDVYSVRCVDCDARLLEVDAVDTA